MYSHSSCSHCVHMNRRRDRRKSLRLIQILIWSRLLTTRANDESIIINVCFHRIEHSCAGHTKHVHLNLYLNGKYVCDQIKYHFCVYNEFILMFLAICAQLPRILLILSSDWAECRAASSANCWLWAGLLHLTESEFIVDVAINHHQLNCTLLRLINLNYLIDGWWNVNMFQLACGCVHRLSGHICWFIWPKWGRFGKWK